MLRIQFRISLKSCCRFNRSVCGKMVGVSANLIFLYCNHWLHSSLNQYGAKEYVDDQDKRSRILFLGKDILNSGDLFVRQFINMLFQQRAPVCVCVCVCAHARACVCVCVRFQNLTLKAIVVIRILGFS